MVDTRAFQEAGIRLSERLHPVCAQEGSLHSYSYWLCYIKHMTLTGPHSVGTCKMGPDSDTSAVVDNQLRYYIVVTGVSLGPSPYLYNFSLKYKWGKFLFFNYENKLVKLHIRRKWISKFKFEIGNGQRIQETVT